MQLDSTRVTIREREFLDLLDLSLRVARVEARPWLIACVVGTLPFALFNYWLLKEWPVSGYARDLPAVQMFRNVALIVFEMPLATAAATTYLGQSMFFNNPKPGQIADDLYRALPQLFLFQVVLRGLWILPAIVFDLPAVLVLLWLIPYLMYPYINEVILLERNPLFARRNRITTWRRSQVLHGGSRGSLFVRWMISATASAAMVFSLLLTLGYGRSLLTNSWPRDEIWRSVFLPISVWVVVWFFTVVRYLSYLDLRIRREGWEVELQVRAAGQRLSASKATLGYDVD